MVSLHGQLLPAQAMHLWVAGELLAQLLARVGQLVGLCHRPEQFRGLALNLLAALEYWCHEVEDSLGPMRWGSVPRDARPFFEMLCEAEPGEED